MKSAERENSMALLLFEISDLIKTHSEGLSHEQEHLGDYKGLGWALVRRTFRRGAQSNGHPSGKGKPQVRSRASRAVSKPIIFRMADDDRGGSGVEHNER
jgi:hypothetical protein